MDFRFEIAIAALLLFILGIVLGARLGDELSIRCVTRRDFWKWSAIIVVVGILASAVVSATGYVVLAAVVLGLIAGALAGLKMGFGESIGPWRYLDRFMRVNRDNVAAADASTRERARAARAKGEPEPELMSVANPNTTKRKNH